MNINTVAILTGGTVLFTKNNKPKAQKGRKGTKSTRTRKRVPPKEE